MWITQLTPFLCQDLLAVFNVLPFTIWCANIAEENENLDVCLLWKLSGAAVPSYG